MVQADGPERTVSANDDWFHDGCSGGQLTSGCRAIAIHKAKYSDAEEASGKAE